MQTKRWMLLAAIAAASSPVAMELQAGLFKIDFGQLENERVLDADGNPIPAPPLLIDWTVIPTWTFADPNANVLPDTATASGTANADGTEVTWKLVDASSNPQANVTLTILDNKALAESLAPDAPPYMQGGTANNPTKEGINVLYDGVDVPYTVKDDYIYRLPDAAGSESLMRIAGLTAGTYNVTVFEGRTTDTARYGKIWVDDIKGAKAPATENTGNYAATDDNGVKLYKGQPRTTTVTVKTGEYLWFAEMEDNSGGVSGLIVRSVDPTDSPGLFKVDFGHMENERAPTLADGSPQLDPEGAEVGPPAPLKDWDVVPTWTFADPNASVTEGSGSLKGTANADGTEVIWKLTDFSKDGNKNVTMTIMDNKPLAESLNADSPPYMQGGTANNPTKEGVSVLYDGVLVPAAVKDDYIYRLPDAAGSESLIRFAGLKPGKYNVTVFEGRTTDGGRTGKIWADDIKGLKAPASENTGSYSGQKDGVALPLGQPRTVTVDIQAGEYLWFAEMEDNSGGVSGLIIRGLPTTAGTGVSLVGSPTVTGTFTAVSDAQVDAATKTITVSAKDSARFFRVQGSSKIVSSALAGANIVIKYE